ncbi:MAG: hypothetical protein AAF921_06015 [Cyanobacteria bacterium P01_D01_bin.44]
MRKLPLLFLICTVLSSCGVGNQVDGGWTYDLPEDGFESLDADKSPDTDEPLDTEESLNPEDVDTLDIAEDEAILSGETIETQLDLPQRGPRPAIPSLGQQPAPDSFEGTGRAHHRSIESPIESPAEPVEPDATEAELSPIELWPSFGTHQGNPTPSDTPLDDISEFSKPEPNATRSSES